MAKLMCPKCKRLTSTSTCPVHKDAKLVETWKGRIIVIEPEKSELAKKINIDASGEYALR